MGDRSRGARPLTFCVSLLCRQSFSRREKRKAGEEFIQAERSDKGSPAELPLHRQVSACLFLYFCGAGAGAGELGGAAHLLFHLLGGTRHWRLTDDSC